MSKWHCEVCGKRTKTKHELIDHLKEERDKYSFEYDQYETADQQLFYLLGETVE